jgi:hypothetical protein
MRALMTSNPHIAWAFDRQGLRQPDAGAPYAALYRVNGAIADFR